MKKFLLSTGALVGFAGVASAADLPARLPPPPPPPIVPAFTWTGFYFGVNAGAAFDVKDNNNNFGGDRFSGDNIRINQGDIRGSQGSAGVLRGAGGGLFNNNNNNDVGFAGGGQIGFNYQFTPGTGFVVGLEADIQFIDIGGNNNQGGNVQRISPANFTPDNPNFGPAGPNTWGAAFDPRPGQRPAERVVRGGLTAQDLNFFGTVRGRLGYAFDRTLIYATGGFAYGGGDTNNNNVDGLFNNTGSNDEFKFGWTVGGGVEFAFTNFQLFGSSAVTFKIEGLYVNLSEDGNNINIQRASYSRATRTLVLPSLGGGGGGNNINDTEFAVVRAGLNFKF